MSLFSRLEERMRARDSQDDSKEKPAAPADDDTGGLFGSIQLKPAQNESSVPPPAGTNADAGTRSGIAVPSLEEARAELDRIRAQNAQSSPSSGLFRRDKAPDNGAAETTRPSAESSGARESVRFGPVSLPPRDPEETPAPLQSPSQSESQPESQTESQPAPQTEFMPTSAPATIAPVASEDAPANESFRVPSLAQFAETAATSDAAAPDAAAPAAAAPDAIASPSANVEEEQTVYAPVAAADSGAQERQVVGRTESQTVSPDDIVTTIEALRPPAPTPSAPEVAPPTEPASAPESTPAAANAEPSDERPAAPISAAPGLTPFQRLMAARAAQAGSSLPRSRNERPASATPPRPVAETPRQTAPALEVPAANAPQADAPQADAPEPEVARAPSLAKVELPQPSAPAIEVPKVELPAAAAPTIEVPALNEPPLPAVPAPVIAADAPLPLPESSITQADENEAPPLQPAALLPNSAAESSSAVFSSGEASISEASDSMPETEAPPAPQESAPQESAPQESAPQESAPQESAPQESAPQESAPQESAPQESAPQESAPQESAPQESAPQESAPQESAPQESASEMETMAAKMDALVAQAREQKTLDSQAPNAESESATEPSAPAKMEEAETVPEQNSTAMASSGAEPSSEMPNPETAEPPARPALSLSERLARAPRAELDAAHAEAEALTPEILETARETPAPARENAREAAPRSGALSFAERLAARNKPQVELPAPATSSAPAAPAAPATPATSHAPAASSAPSSAAPGARGDGGESSDEAAAPAPRSGPRSFSERLAARTSLDNHLQVPAPESAPPPQDLATHHTELARINEGTELSEREMKNRVLFRQKHLIFDNVIGALDQRTMQNPTRATVKPQIEKGVDAALREYGLELEASERNWLVDEFTREVTDLGALVPMLEDPSVNKIVVTGANDVSVERLGRIERTGVSFRDDDHLLSLVRRIAEMSGGRVDAKVPLLDRPLPDGGRIRAKVPPLAPQPTLTIEKSTGNPFVVLKRQMDEKSRGDALPYAQLRERIQQRLLREFEGDAAALAGDQDKLRGQVEEMIGSVIAEEHVAVTRAERASLVMDLLNEIVGLGPIEPLLNDPDVDEVMVNGPYQIYVERKGKLELTSQRFRDNGHVMQVIDRIVAPLGRRVDEKSPMVDGRLRDGSRFNAIIPPLALSGPTMTIRKFARDPFTMSDLINFGTITREAAQFLQAAVEGRLNIVVSGGTGSGKTTTLNVLSSFIPSTERIVTIEDAAELQMRQEHVIRMETRPPNIEGVGEVGIRDLVKNSLRMRPDRIVVGECRGGEALDMLQAMNTGHDGSLTTAHSNGPRDTCKRLETMVMMAGFDLPVRAIREQISMAVQLVVHQERMRDGKRRVTAVTEIVGMEGDVLTLQDIFRFEQEGIDDDGRIIGSLQATGMRPKYYETIVDNGGTISMDIFAPKAHESAPRARLNERGGR